MADQLDAELCEWIVSLTGVREVVATRRAGGASREGWAIDAGGAFWLRLDTGHGPQSDGIYTLRREAAVYRALADAGRRVPRVLGVHPTRDAFLSTRVDGATWFSRISDPAEQEAIARDFMAELAAIHALDAATLGVDELGPVRDMRAHVLEEIAIWEAQHLRQYPVPDPLIVFCIDWLRRNLTVDDRERVVLVQGDTGPGNFLYADGRVTAVLDWELSHWGDFHDDLAWICVRDLQERFTTLRDRFADYERASGRSIDMKRLRYFRVLAQLRCSIGTLNGLALRDAGSEMANHLIYSTLHYRVLAEALADAVGLPTADPNAIVPDDGAPADTTWVYDVALDEIRDTIVPRSTDSFATHRAKGLARLLKYARECDRLGLAVRDAELADAAALVGPVSSRSEADLALVDAIRRSALDSDAAIAYFVRRVQRQTQLTRPAMGALADRHYADL